MVPLLVKKYNFEMLQLKLLFVKCEAAYNTMNIIDISKCRSLYNEIDYTYIISFINVLYSNY